MNLDKIDYDIINKKAMISRIIDELRGTECDKVRKKMLISSFFVANDQLKVLLSLRDNAIKEEDIINEDVGL